MDYKIVPNHTATAAEAPYLGQAIPKGSLGYDNILRTMVDSGTHMTTATARFFLDAFYELVAETVSEEFVRVSTGSVTVYPSITGSFDTEDAGFDPARNALVVEASVSRSIQDGLDAEVPRRGGEDAVVDVRINTVYDLESMEQGVLRGGKEARIAGANLQMPALEDEALELWSRDGSRKVADFEFVSNDGGQLITVRLAAAATVPKGKYRIRLASHGLDPTSPLKVVTTGVTVPEAVEGAAMAKVVEADNPEDNVVGIPSETAVTIHGSKLAGLTAANFKVIGRNPETGEPTGEELALKAIDPAQSDATKLVLPNGLVELDTQLEDDDEPYLVMTVGAHTQELKLTFAYA